MKTTICTKCGSKINIAEKVKSVYCFNCKTTFDPDDSHKNSIDIDFEITTTDNASLNPNKHEKSINNSVYYQDPLRFNKKLNEKSLKNYLYNFIEKYFYASLRAKVFIFLILIGIVLFEVQAYNSRNDNAIDSHDHLTAVQTEGNRTNEEEQADNPGDLEAYTISKNFLDDYVTDVNYGFVENPVVVHTGNVFTVFYHFSVNHVKYNFECTMAYIGGKWSDKKIGSYCFYTLKVERFIMTKIILEKIISI